MNEDGKFWDREKELELFIDALDQGSHLLLVAPRRRQNQPVRRAARAELSHMEERLRMVLGPTGPRRGTI